MREIVYISNPSKRKKNGRNEQASIAENPGQDNIHKSHPFAMRKD